LVLGFFLGDDMADPVVGNAQQLTTLQQQLGDVVEAKSLAITKLTAALTNGPTVSYSITGKAGSESVSATEYLTYLREQIKGFVDLEKELMDLIQRLQPYIVSTRLSL
jgi:hypothetical protein